MELKKSVTSQMEKEMRFDGEEELAAPDWRVRAGPRSKPTQRERGARSNKLAVPRLVRTLYDGKGSHPSPCCKAEE